MPEPLRIGIVAAMKREVAGLLEGWQKSSNGQLYTCDFPQIRAALVVAGAGAANAEAASHGLICQFSPSLVLSVGFAGALLPELEVGEIIVPAQVAREGCAAELNYSTEFGEGVLLTVNRVVGKGEKAELARRHGACAVEMEAASVASVARARGVKFAAIKAISDRLDDAAIDLTAPFVRPAGFDTAGFLFHIALRPKLWPAVAKLKSGSERAGLALCHAVQEFLAAPEKFAAQQLQHTTQTGPHNLRSGGA
jgi:adenosylhomocysteine nucleosidase